MAALSLAIIGKNNEPLFIREFFDHRNGSHEDLLSEEELFGLTTRPDNREVSGSSHKCCSLRQRFILHAALDRFEQLAGPPPGYGWRTQSVSGPDAMFVGLLCPVEDMRVYGYMTTTLIKLLLTVEDSAEGLNDQRAVDESIKNLFIDIHRIYAEYTLNPFSPLSGAIVSTRFDEKIEECVKSFNHTVAP